ncbi:MAG: MarR family winged helix-turn-helix transcriptional regulator [Myxococcota bacterium]
MADYEQRLARAKKQSLMQPLFRAARLLTELGLRRKAPREGPHPRPSHMALYPHIELAGTRPSVLAERLGITPQAVAQLVADLETMGFVERVPDPADGRARLVRFTDLGQQDILDGFIAFERVEAEIAARLDEGELATLRDLVLRLEAIADELIRDPDPDPSARDDA